MFHREYDIINLTPTELVGVFESTKFRSVLNRTAKFTERFGRETGFNVEITAEKRIFIPHIKIGNTDSLAGAEWKIVDDSNIEDPNGVLLDFHFHPTLGTIRPSGSDLITFLDYPNHALMGVGRVKSGVVDILIIKSRFGIINLEDIHCYEDIAYTVSQEAIIELLDDCGMESRIISFRKNPLGYILTNDSKTLLRELGALSIPLTA